MIQEQNELNTTLTKKNTSVKSPQHDYFEEHGYIYLTEVLSKEMCADLTKMMFDLYEKGELEKDGQCPLSDSIYGHPIFDKLLEELALPFGHNIGRTLLPAYTYARIYRPGETLKRHVDRPSCELSATMTLGHDQMSELWPIFMSKDPADKAGNSVIIDVGDCVFYKGNELVHWRPEYVGEWQVQVFFHYVDANGPHKEYAYDKRESLGSLPLSRRPVYEEEEEEVKPENLVKTKEKSILETYSQTLEEEEIPIQQLNNCLINPKTMWNKNKLPGAMSFNSNFKPHLKFTPEECLKIKDIAKNKYARKATVGTGGEGKYKDEIRRVDQFELELNAETAWIWNKLMQGITVANIEHFKYEILGITHGLQLLKYNSEDKGFYDWHVDIGDGQAATRKLSSVTMLSDPSDYEGGELMINTNGLIIQGDDEQGAVNMFPSYMLHKVEPVTKGERWVLVIWVHGTEGFR